MTTLTSASRPSFVRGDYISFSGMATFGVTTSGAARGANSSKTRRVINVSGSALDVRDCSRYRAVEWLRARAEDLLLWPLADLKAKIRVRALSE